MRDVVSLLLIGRKSYRSHHFDFGGGGPPPTPPSIDYSVKSWGGLPTNPYFFPPIFPLPGIEPETRFLEKEILDFGKMFNFGKLFKTFEKKRLNLENFSRLLQK